MSPQSQRKRLSSSPIIVLDEVDLGWCRVPADVIDDAITRASFELERSGPQAASVWLKELDEIRGWRRAEAQELRLKIIRLLQPRHQQHLGVPAVPADIVEAGSERQLG